MIAFVAIMISIFSIFITYYFNRKIHNEVADQERRYRHLVHIQNEIIERWSSRFNNHNYLNEYISWDIDKKPININKQMENPEFCDLQYHFPKFWKEWLTVSSIINDYNKLTWEICNNVLNVIKVNTDLQFIEISSNKNTGYFPGFIKFLCAYLSGSDLDQCTLKEDSSRQRFIVNWNGTDIARSKDKSILEEINRLINIFSRSDHRKIILDIDERKKKYDEIFKKRLIISELANHIRYVQYLDGDCLYLPPK